MKKVSLFLYSVLVVVLCSCYESALNANDIIDRSITAHGSDVANNARLEFTFRGIHYSVDRKDGTYAYERSFEKNGKPLVDRLDNNGFTRTIEDSLQQLPDSLSTRYRASLNSVIYFAQLPFSLDGDAVNLEHLGMDQINEENYHQIKVTFKENGGGEDHEDEFIYWIHAETFLIDYLAYSYCEDDCGARFRESVNRRNLNGVIVQDYNNYRSTKTDPVLEELGDSFEAGELILMSEIKTEFPTVTLNK